jgi:prophage regulatory protein
MESVLDEVSRGTERRRGVTTGSLQLIDIERLAEITGLSKPTLWRHNEAGLIPAGMKIGRAVRWRLADVERWIESGCPHCGSGVNHGS